MKDTNRHIAIVALMLAIPTLVAAQEVNHHQDNNDGVPQPHFDDSALQRIMPTRYGGRSRKWREEALAEEARSHEVHQDSLNLPILNQYGQPETIGICRME